VYYNKKIDLNDNTLLTNSALTDNAGIYNSELAQEAYQYKVQHYKFTLNKGKKYKQSQSLYKKSSAKILKITLNESN
jgi:hypothetical protein